MSRTSAASTIHGRLELLDAARLGWLRDLAATSAAVAAARGLPATAVADQLTEVLNRLAGATILQTLHEDLGDAARVDMPDARPSEVLVLAAGTVPGLALEAAWWVMAMGSTAQVVPSRRDPSITGLALQLQQTDSPLCDQLVINDQIDWTSPDAAIIFGADATIDLVRSRLGADARVNGFGHRESVAIISASCATDATIADLAADIAHFGQQGCMSPVALMVIGDRAAATDIRDRLARALADNHSHAGAEPAAAGPAAVARHTTDELLLSGMHHQAPAAHALASISQHGMTVSVTYGDAASVDAWLATWQPDVLSTAVIAVADSETRAVMAVAAGCGATRCCAPGEAHHQPANWRHEGVGFIQPLLAAP